MEYPLDIKHETLNTKHWRANVIDSFVESKVPITLCLNDRSENNSLKLFLLLLAGGTSFILMLFVANVKHMGHDFRIPPSTGVLIHCIILKRPVMFSVSLALNLYLHV